MERSFFNEDFDFEQLIKQKSDQYKMYPSDKVWKGINASLHSSRKWYWLGMVVFLAGISYYAIEQLAAVSRKNIAGTKNSQRSTEPMVKPATHTPEAVILPFTPVIEKNKQVPISYTRENAVVITMDPLENDLSKESTIVAGTENSLTKPENSALVSLPAISSIEKATTPNNKILNSTEIIPAAVNVPVEKAASKEGTVTPADDVKEIAETVTKNNPLVLIPEVENNSQATDEKRINWLQENAVYELTQPKLKKLSWQIGLTPTTNYRNLVGNKNAVIASDAKNIPIALNIQGDLKNLVKHTPAMGFEVSSVFLYAVNKNLTFKTGVQFNYARYEIKAYTSNATDRATIALNNFYGPVDSITNLTRIRNFGGTSQKDLQNQYFQLAVPVGLELVVLGKRRLQIAVAGTIQPTYILNRDNYLISTDYKNYTREPSLVRRWNMNSSIEAFMSYKVGNYKFQLGPQFRYQLLSTYDDKYPVKEFLKEYGLKLAVSKSIR